MEGLRWRGWDCRHEGGLVDLKTVCGRAFDSSVTMISSIVRERALPHVFCGWRWHEIASRFNDFPSFHFQQRHIDKEP